MKTNKKPPKNRLPALTSGLREALGASLDPIALFPTGWHWIGKRNDDDEYNQGVV